MRAIKALVTGKRGGAVTLELENGLTCQFATKKVFRILQSVSVIYDAGKMEIKEVLTEQECLDLDKVPDCTEDFIDCDAAEVVENLLVDVIPEDLSVPEV
jgi:hypothetical protein